MRILARVRATLKNILWALENKTHDRYCPCGALSSEPVEDTVPTRLVPDEYDQNREATPHVCETSRCWQECHGAGS